MAKKSNAKFIILICFIILIFLLAVILLVLNAIQSMDQPEDVADTSSNVKVSVEDKKKEKKTIQEIIENAGSVYLGQTGTITYTVYVDFRYDLFDENGKSRKQYFYDIIQEIGELEKNTFYLVDSNKNIKIAAIYNPKTGRYTITINGVEDYYDTVDGDTYLELSKVTERKLSKFIVYNELLRLIGTNSSYYAHTQLANADEREEIGNGYYSYQNGAIIAKLQSGKALNIIFRDGYTDSFAPGIYVKTSLEDILKKYPEPSFGSIRDRYLGYITEFAYIFFYEDEVSVYPYEYKENTYFDKYIAEFCSTGNFEKFVNDFTDDWTSYFEKEIDESTGSFKISFPTRGIKIDIVNENPKGITLYNNYYLTETVKDWIKAKKITLEPDQDLVVITEKSRREAM